MVLCLLIPLFAIEFPTVPTGIMDYLHKLLITLRYLVTGKMQLCNGDDMGVSQPTVSRAISVTLDSLTSPALVSRFIRFPTNATVIRKNQEGFFAIAGFPGIFGAINGTHIQIIAPHEYENTFVNRHHYHRINYRLFFIPTPE